MIALFIESGRERKSGIRTAAAAEKIESIKQKSPSNQYFMIIRDFRYFVLRVRRSFSLLENFYLIN